MQRGRGQAQHCHDPATYAGTAGAPVRRYAPEPEPEPEEDGGGGGGGGGGGATGGGAICATIGAPVSAGAHDDAVEDGTDTMDVPPP